MLIGGIGYECAPPVNAGVCAPPSIELSGDGPVDGGGGIGDNEDEIES